MTDDGLLTTLGCGNTVAFTMGHTWEKRRRLLGSHCRLVTPEILVKVEDTLGLAAKGDLSRGIPSNLDWSRTHSDYSSSRTFQTIMEATSELSCSSRAAQSTD